MSAISLFSAGAVFAGRRVTLAVFVLLTLAAPFCRALPDARAQEAESAAGISPVANKEREKQDEYRVALIGDAFFTNPGLSAYQNLERQLTLFSEAKKLPVTLKNFSETDAQTIDAAENLIDILKWRPDIAVVHLGLNDLKSKIPPGAVKRNLDKILYNLLYYGVRVIFYGAEAPVTLYEHFDYNTGLADRYAEEFERNYIELAGKYPVLYRPPLSRELGNNIYYLMPDRVNPNQRGVERITRKILYELSRVTEFFDDTRMLHNMAYNEPKRVLILGDRLFVAFKGYEDMSFGHLLQRHVREDRQKANVLFENVSGAEYTVDKVKSRYKRMRSYIALQPDLVILHLGVNDLLGGAAPKIIAQDLLYVAGNFRANNVQTLITGVTEVKTDSRYVRRRFPTFAKIFPLVAEKSGSLVVPDILADIKGYEAGSKSTILDKESMNKLVRRVWGVAEDVIVAIEEAERAAYLQ